MKYANQYLEKSVRPHWANATFTQKVYLTLFMLWFKIMMARNGAKQQYRKRGLLSVALWASAVGFVVRVITTDVDSWHSLAALFLSCMMLCLIAFATLWTLFTAFILLFNYTLSWWAGWVYPTSHTEAFITIAQVEDENARAAAQAYIMAFSHRTVTQVTIALSMMFAADQEVNAQ
ncbi:MULTISPECIES: hypothetical protein [Enterobacterales]|jgi:hypothetical protein|uniref:Uncharacterized protein n=7 Tax=Enterobacterales TaxID=91347 RepID=A0A899NJE3_PROST|nr:MULTISPECIES: hypothetical protein [Enterobacterales]URQ57402.1 Hypothetical protein [Providencia alcalifaciens]EKH6496520.1 hypothetical protein [Providencia rettgeri]ELB1110461.1 hypothetical protein [Morganella morganii]ELL8907468.1 hypothetical protein [Proteus mirabilis]ELQ1458044.1 hypothetical protein [Providencia rettgeri]